jgi:glycosyltransferase involved in cell wall biosynthesis
MTRKVCFIVNVDWFFDSHRRPLQQKLEEFFNCEIVAGDTKSPLDYEIKKFEVSSRIPTLKGFFQLKKIIKEFNEHTNFIVVSPIMIFVIHFFFPNLKKVHYNFSGLGFLRSKSQFLQLVLFNTFSLYPFKGFRSIVVQNSDDLEFMQKVFRKNKKIYVSLIPGSGYEKLNESTIHRDDNSLRLGFVGRIRKDKGILDLLDAVNDLRTNEKMKVELYIWGKLDDSSRHGFSKNEIKIISSNSEYFFGESKDKNEIFSSFDWFCLPSNGEGISKAAIEAASYKKPLLLSNSPGNKDMIDKNGFLYTFSNVNDLKNKIRLIYSLNFLEYGELANRSFELYKENWTLRSISENWIKLIEKYDNSRT